MSAVDLILLGIVFEQPRSAYDIQKQVEYRNLSKWVKISSPSIYKKVIQLEAKGYLASEPVREGKMPEKAVYSITPAGRAYFISRMKETAASAVSVLFDFNAVIAGLNKVPKQMALALIDDIRSGMNESKAYMESMVPQRVHIPLVGRTILDQQIEVLGTLLSWIERFKDEFNGQEAER